MAKGFNKFAGGGANNMNAMLKQAQKMQEEMAKTQSELEEKVFEASAGGGAVTVQAKGGRALLSVKLRPEAVDPDDVEMLEDLILAAANEALKKAADEMEAGMGRLTGGLNIPGLF
jgi:DNA-binding YbaB/EbfC family protein